MQNFLIVVLLKLLYGSEREFWKIYFYKSIALKVREFIFANVGPNQSFGEFISAGKTFSRSSTNSTQNFPGLTYYYHYLLLLLSLPLLSLGVIFYLLILLDKRPLQAF